MGYRMQYSPEKCRRYPIKEMRKKWGGKILVCFSVGIVLIGFICARWEQAKELLLPGDPEHTLQALNTLAEDMKEGESVKEAITAFCGNILEHAQNG